MTIERALDALRYLSGQASHPRRRAALLPPARLAAGGGQSPGAGSLRDAGRRGPAAHRRRLAMQRIRGRGRSLQAHETPEALDALAAGYERICELIETHHGVRVVRIAVTDTDQEEDGSPRGRGRARERPAAAGPPGGRSAGARRSRSWPRRSPGPSRISARSAASCPQFAARTRRPVHLHTVDSHAEAEAATHDIVVARRARHRFGRGRRDVQCRARGLPPRRPHPRRRAAGLPAQGLGRPHRQGPAHPRRATGAVVGHRRRHRTDRRLRADVIAVEHARSARRT